MKKANFRSFVQDVGERGYSGFAPVHAETIDSAIELMRRMRSTRKIIVLPEDQPELWPDGKTGLLPHAAWSYLGSTGQVQ